MFVCEFLSVSVSVSVCVCVRAFVPISGVVLRELEAALCTWRFAPNIVFGLIVASLYSGVGSKAEDVRAAALIPQLRAFFAL